MYYLKIIFSSTLIGDEGAYCLGKMIGNSEILSLALYLM